MQRLSYEYRESYTVSYTFRAGNRTLLFLHGYLQAEDVWYPFVNHIPKEYGILMVNLPGHGGTSCFGNNYFSKFCLALNELLLAHKVEKVHLIGHSMGGYLALQFLRDFSSKAASLTLLHSTPLADTPERSRKRIREKTIIEMGKIHLILSPHFENLFAPQNRARLAEIANQYRELALKVTPTAMCEALTSMSLRGSYVSDCLQAHKPILLLFGRYDELLTPERAHKCQIEVPNIEYHYMEESGHTCFVEEPEKTLALLLCHLNKT